MRTGLRSLAFGLTTFLGLTAMGQFPYTVIVSGHIDPCSPAVANGTVNIQTIQNTQPSYNVTVDLNENCFYTYTFGMNDPDGWFSVTGNCMNGTADNNSGSYLVNVLTGVGELTLDLDCGNTPDPCQACLEVVQGSDAPLNPVLYFIATINNCSSGGTAPFTYTVNWGDGSTGTIDEFHQYAPGLYTVCMTMTDAMGCQSVACDDIYVDEEGIVHPAPPACQPCFTVAQSSGGGALTPFSADFTNCSTGVPAGYTYTWDFADGSTAQGENATHVFAAPGPYYVCLIITDPIGQICSTLCQDVIVDENGTINPATDPCEAGFWAMQAYDGDPNSGTGTPIPYELWIWNLSSGGTGLFQFLWEFGDGTSSTEAFPTHTYSGTGPYDLCLTIWDSEGCTDEYCDEISVDEDGMLNGMVGGGDDRSTLTINVRQPLSTDVAEHNFTELSVWPNPVSDELNIGLASGMVGNVPVTVFDANGREVISITRPVMDGKNRFTLPTSELVPGMYLLRIGSGSDIAVHRFAKTY